MAIESDYLACVGVLAISLHTLVARPRKSESLVPLFDEASLIITTEVPGKGSHHLENYDVHPVALGKTKVRQCAELKASHDFHVMPQA